MKQPELMCIRARTSGVYPAANPGAHKLLTAAKRFGLAIFTGIVMTTSMSAQCIVDPGQLRGAAFLDAHADGSWDMVDQGLADAYVQVYDKDGQLVTEAFTDATGAFVIDGLDNGELYRVEWTLPDYVQTGRYGTNSKTRVQMVAVPGCTEIAAVDPAQYCDEVNPPVAVTCFVKGGPGENDQMETIVTLEYLFKPTSAVNKIAMKGQTGSVWGLAWKASTKVLYSTALMKQHAYLASGGTGGIYKTTHDGNEYQTELFASLAALGYSAGDLLTNDPTDCNYGSQVGKIGLGGIALSGDESTLYVVNVDRSSVIALPSESPNFAQMREYPIADPGCVNGAFRIFALKYYKGKLYVGGTCTADGSRNEADLSIHIFELNPEDGNVLEIFTSNYPKGYWYDQPADVSRTSHWLTDIEFTRQGNIIISLADRMAHRYCGNGQILNQFPDILMVWKDDQGVWHLENNGIAGNLVGTGQNNGQGPGGGEFFGEDHWIIHPNYHPEVAMGSVFQLPHSDEIVLTAFDPLYNTFAGGMHRYNTTNGKKTGAIELYQTTNGNPTFGKASGLGDIIAMCGPAPLEIGNLLWVDANENGVQDPDEAPMAGVELTLYDSDCQKVGVTVTDAWGQYLFNDTNVDTDFDGQPDGLAYHSDYYVVVSDNRFDAGFGVLEYEDEFFKPTQFRTGMGSNPRENDSDVRLADAGMCAPIASKPYLRVTTGGSGQNAHSYDFGFQSADAPPRNDFFDLALRFTTNQVLPVKMGQEVQFDVTVFNQGDIAAGSICLVDYLSQGYRFSPDNNPDWDQVGNKLFYNWEGELLPGESITVSVILEVRDDATHETLVHFAEICGATDTNGVALNDIDSTPDSNPTNDAGGQPQSPADDYINGDGSGTPADDVAATDEDDHDPVQLDIFDLSLKKSTANMTPAKIGEDILFNLELTNEGNVAARNIRIGDYLPQGLIVSPNDIAGWQMNGNMATVMIQSVLPPREKISIQLLLRVTPDFQVAQAENRAEIIFTENESGDDYSAYDFDSTPDNEMPGEDDIDIAEVPVFDLALRKRTVQNKSYRAGESLECVIEVFNQGNLAADGFDIVDHLPAGLHLSPVDANGWNLIEPAIARLSVEEMLHPGESRQFKILLTLGPDVEDGVLINIAEISAITPALGYEPVDFDSHPDLNPNNDIGGEADTSTDDMIDDNGTIDEDDHDPAVIRIMNDPDPVVDLAIFKSTKSTDVRPGDNVTFDILLVNQGEVTVSGIDLVDYLPEMTTLNDPAWGSVNVPNHGPGAQTRLSIQNGRLPEDGLEPGDSVGISIVLRVKDDTEPGRYFNFVEITSMDDMDGTDISGLDIDSSPDMNPHNDMEGMNGGPILGNQNELGNHQREDDFHFAEFVVNSVERSIACECLDNASTPNDGQFLDEIEVYALSGQTWFIEEVVGLFDPASPAPPAPPLSFDTGPSGELLAETPDTNGMSFYRLQGIHVDGQGYYIIVRNEFNERLIVQNVTCYYDQPQIIGLDRVCRGSMTNFSVLEPVPGVTYEWSLSSGGTFVGGNTGSSVKIMWDSQDGGPHILTVDETFPDTSCMSPTEMAIFIGQEARSVSCKSLVNLSIDEDCEIDITARMLLTGGPYEYNAYAVMLTDRLGNPVPNQALGREYLGEELMAKVINVCTGNSCWSTVTIEDKMPPMIRCLDDTLRCNNMSEYTGPLVTDNCDPNPEVILLDERIETIDCNEEFIKRVTRYYQAKDDAGNTSDVCEQTILLRRINLDSIVFPDDRVIVDGNPLICGAYPLDKNGHPDPEFTGVPFLEGFPIYPYPDFYCNAAVHYMDTELPGNGCVRKIMRVWTAREFWCSRIVRASAVQLIEITDNVAPVVECPRDMTVTVDNRKCEATVVLPPAEVTDNCSTPIHVDVIYPGGILQGQNGGLVTLPLGINEVIYRATDACYNTSECVMLVEVQDKTAPVAVCDKHTVVGLTITGFAEVWAQTFDDGSYDGCWIDSMAVRRMEGDPICGLQQNEFAPSVLFCCEDAGQDIMVEFRVWDSYGNANSCMVEVTVQDKLPPVIEDLPSDTIGCHHIPTEEELDAIYGFPVVTDNCDFDFTSSTQYFINQCMEGTIVRLFEVSDANNTSMSTQLIVVINEDPFTEDDIIWPLDFETDEGCNADDLHPDNLPSPFDYPHLTEDECDLTGFTWEDDTFEFVQNSDACFKILRRWKVINWCRKDRAGNPIIYTHEQVIKVHDIGAPVITTPCDSASTCTYDPECEDGFIELVQEATDECTPDNQLQWEYQVDLDKDGVIDIVVKGVGSVADASGDYPIGSHSIKYSFEDKCGNKTSCTQFFEIINCKAPIMRCINGIIVELMPMDLDGDGELDAELVELWASDLDAGSSHPCGYPLTFSFGRDTTIKSRIYDCDSIGRRMVTICATTPNGNQSCCTTEVIVQDNNNVHICDDIGCVLPPPDIRVTDCTQRLDPGSLNSFPDTSMCPQRFQFTISFVDRGLIPTPPECGKIERTWTVELDMGGRIITRVFVQIITLEIELDESDIMWPDDVVELDNCSDDTHPDAIGSRPLLLENFCGLVRVTFNDVDISDPTDVCLTLRRTWTVTNLCDPAVVFTFVQTIIVFNYDAPIVTCPDDVTVHSVPNACGANVTLAPAFTTDCSTGVTFTNDFNAGGANASGFYPVGTTTVTFTATDKCGASSSCQTNVVVLDTIPPVIICPADQTVSCEFEYENLSEFGEPIIIDNCMVTVTKDSIFNLDDCQIGTITRKWVVTDASNNQDSCMQLITFENPIPFTESNITWPADSLEINNCGSLHPDSIMSRPLLDTVNTTCHMVTVEYVDVDISDTLDVCLTIERTWTVENLCTPQAAYTFTQYINQLNGEAPLLTCPPDVTVSADPDSCGASVNLDDATTTDCSSGVTITNDFNAGGANASGFYPTGSTTVTFTAVDECGQMSTCEVVVTVIEDVAPIITCPADVTVDCDFVWTNLSEFGEPEVEENCSFTIERDSIIDLNNCQIGTITRSFVVTDDSGNQDSCTQTIVFENPNPFNEPDHIIWPMDTLNIDSCVASTHPDSIMSRPMIDTASATCNLVTVTWEDVSNSFCNASPCLEIERTWTVTDSCQLDTTVTPPAGQWTFTQIINVNDFDPPVIFGVMDTTIVTDSTTCDRFVELIAMAMDCDPNVMLSHNSPYAMNMNSGDASGEYPIGVTEVTFYAEDACCNIDSLTITVEIIDSIAPVAECMKSIKVMPDTLSVPFYPWDMVSLLFDNCTDSADITLSYDPVDPNDTVRVITCDSLDHLGEYLAAIDIYITDEAGNQDTCTGFINVVDPDTLCPRMITGGIIAGSLRTEMGDQLAEAQVFLDGSGMQPDITGTNGRYAFPPMPMGGKYVIRPIKDIDPMNGVSTKDILRVQRHLLGQEPLETPYQMIAADVDRSNRISARDLLWLRKMILGYESGFPNGNTSWRFVDAGFTFPYPDNPFATPFPEMYDIDRLNGHMSVHFIGVKIGDVTGNAKVNGLVQTEGRQSAEALYLGIEDANIPAGATVAIEVSGENLAQFEGFQATLGWDPDLVTVLRAEPASEAFADYHMNPEKMAEGRLPISWNTNREWVEHTPLIRIFVQAKQAVRAADIFTIDQSYMVAEAYDRELQTGPVRLLSARQTATIGSPVLYQNQPNPFADATHIVFSLPEAAEVTLTVYQLNGQAVWRQVGHFEAGMHSVLVNGTELNTSGMFIYRLETNDFTASKRMFMAR